MSWQPLYPSWAYWLLVVVCIGVIVAARRMAIAPRLRSWFLLAPRLVLLLLLAVMLLNPVERRQTRLPPQQPSVALLVDCSQSMLLGRPRSRLAMTREAISSAINVVPPKNRPRLAVYRFGEHLVKSPGIAELDASDQASRLGAAVERLSSRFADDAVRAVVVFSDGNVDDKERLPGAAKAYAELGIPVFAYAPEEEPLRGDVAITELAVPPRVAAGETVVVRASVSSHGYAGRRVVVSLRGADRSAPPLASLPITLRNGSLPVELPVEVDAESSRVVLEIAELPGEAIGENNRVPFRLNDGSRRLKVLYMEGTQGREYRWLQEAIQEDTEIECVAMVVNNQSAARPRLQRIDDPYRGFPTTREELFGYDVVICSDISQAAFTPEQIDWVVELVNRRGGGFAMVGGYTSFGSGGWDRTAWEKLSPFDMAGRRTYLNTRFRVRIPEEAESHPIWRIRKDPVANRQALDVMPPFLGTNLISRVKPAATLLGETYTPLPQIGVMPVFACETYGRGRTFAMSTDTTVGWGTYFESQWGEGDNRYFCKFWRNVVRWLSENSRASQRQLFVETDKLIYSPGDPIQVDVEAFNENQDLTTEYRLTAQLHPEDASEAEQNHGDAVELAVRSVVQNYRGQVTAILPQSSDQIMRSVRLLVTAWHGDEEVATAETGLQILRNSGEWMEPQAHPEHLSALLEISGGRRLESESELSELLGAFEPAPGETVVHLLPRWHSVWLYAVLLAFVATEWILRRRGPKPASGEIARSSRA